METQTIPSSLPIKNRILRLKQAFIESPHDIRQELESWGGAHDPKIKPEITGMSFNKFGGNFNKQP